jgi:hypothetical protein
LRELAAKPARVCIRGQVERLHLTS